MGLVARMVNSVLAGGAVAHRVVDRGFQHFVVDRGFQHFILPALDIGPGVDNDAGQALALSRAAHKGLGRVDPEAFLSGQRELRTRPSGRPGRDRGVLAMTGRGRRRSGCS